jgi:hypothetical protein
MTVFIKAPAAVLDYTVNWNDGYLAAGETISTSSWTVDPLAAVTVASETHDTTTATVTVSGGAAGTVVRLVNRIVTSLGRTDERAIVDLIGDR